MSQTRTEVEADGATRAPRLRWWREALYALGFYLVYSTIRNQFGSAAVGPELAFDNAVLVIEAQRALGLFFEPHVQAVFLDWTPFIRFWNIFYGTAHFVVTAFALIWLFRRDKVRYPLWRNTLAFMTAVALLGFALFPLMPPRLLNAESVYGGAAYATEDYELVDTLAEVGGGLWSFESDTMQSISNQYAAMPSLHIGWALWSMCVLLLLVRRPWVRAVVISYPFLTLFGIVVTGNHYWLDAVGGALVFAAGYALARPFTDWTGRLWARGHEPAQNTR